MEEITDKRQEQKLERIHLHFTYHHGLDGGETSQDIQWIHVLPYAFGALRKTGERQIDTAKRTISGKKLQETTRNLFENNEVQPREKVFKAIADFGSLTFPIRTEPYTQNIYTFSIGLLGLSDENLPGVLDGLEKILRSPELKSFGDGFEIKEVPHTASIYLGRIRYGKEYLMAPETMNYLELYLQKKFKIDSKDITKQYCKCANGTKNERAIELIKQSKSELVKCGFDKGFYDALQVKE